MSFCCVCVLVGFFADRDVLPGCSILGKPSENAAASKLLIVIVSTAFYKDQTCRILLDELLMSATLFTYGAYLSSYHCQAGRQVLVPIVLGECQLPFGLTSAELLIRCREDNALQPADMLRLRRLLKCNVLS